MTNHTGNGFVTYGDGSTTRGDYQIIEGKRGMHMLYFIPSAFNKSTLSHEGVSFESVSHHFKISELVWGGFTLNDAGTVIKYAYLDRHKTK